MDGGGVSVGNRQEIVHTEARPPQTLHRHASRCSHSTRACVRRRSAHGGVQSGTATFVAFRPVTDTDIGLRGEHLPPERGWFGKPPTVGVAMQSRLPAHPRRDQIRHQWMIDQRGAGSQVGKDVGAGWDRQDGCGLSCSMTRTDPANPPEPAFVRPSGSQEQGYRNSYDRNKVSEFDSHALGHFQSKHLGSNIQGGFRISDINLEPTVTSFIEGEEQIPCPPARYG